MIKNRLFLRCKEVKVIFLCFIEAVSTMYVLYIVCTISVKVFTEDTVASSIIVVYLVKLAGVIRPYKYKLKMFCM